MSNFYWFRLHYLEVILSFLHYLEVILSFRQFLFAWLNAVNSSSKRLFCIPYPFCNRIPFIHRFQFLSILVYAMSIIPGVMGLWKLPFIQIHSVMLMFLRKCRLNWKRSLSLCEIEYDRDWEKAIVKHSHPNNQSYQTATISQPGG